MCLQKLLNIFVESTMKKLWEQKKYTLCSMISLAVIVGGTANISLAKVTGVCANCHTMHNSQGGSDMATYGADGKPWKTAGAQPALLRGTCLGCHGMGTANKIETIGDSQIPQVYHTDSANLAAGNFKYIDDDDNRGHNVIDFGNSEDTLTMAPGHHYSPIDNPATSLGPAKLTCAGAQGCHGKRLVSGSTGAASLKGAHHQNVDGKCDTADTIANSYRFLSSVKGFENMGANKYQNLSSTDHNEYYGATTTALPEAFGCTTSCHDSSDNMSIIAPGNTISGFCASCHGLFHAAESTGGDGSPFIRHPTDIVIKNEGEYAGYTTYSVEAPVGRTTVSDSISGVVTPGTDVVTCLSCHASHASNFPDMLRWDYTGMIAGGGGNTGGCFTCHTTKDGA